MSVAMWLIRPNWECVIARSDSTSEMEDAVSKRQTCRYRRAKRSLKLATPADAWLPLGLAWTKAPVVRRLSLNSWKPNGTWTSRGDERASRQFDRHLASNANCNRSGAKGSKRSATGIAA